MGLLDTLMGGGQPQDFLRRFEQGADVSHEESLNQYQAVAGQLSPSQYEEAAREALARLSPQQRMELVEQMRRGAEQHNVNVPMFGQATDQLHDPGTLAGLMSQLRQQQPGIIQRLLGGGGVSSAGDQGPFQSPMAKVALAGIAAIGLKKFLSSRG